MSKKPDSKTTFCENINFIVGERNIVMTTDKGEVVLDEKRLHAVAMLVDDMVTLNLTPMSFILSIVDILDEIRNVQESNHGCENPGIAGEHPLDNNRKH